MPLHGEGLIGLLKKITNRLKKKRLSGKIKIIACANNINLYNAQPLTGTTGKK